MIVLVVNSGGSIVVSRKLISKIDKTLHLIGTGDYGYCKTCGIEIALNRLEARPTADQCIDCKTVEERKEI